MTFWDRTSTKVLLYAEIFVIFALVIHVGWANDAIEDMKDAIEDKEDFEGNNTSSGGFDNLSEGPFGVLMDIMPFFWLIMIAFMVLHIWVRMGRNY